MPRQETYKVHLQDKNRQREYVVTYKDDSIERAKAVSLFESYSMYPELLPDELEDLAFEEAQHYLNTNHRELRWESLFINKEISDSDLSHLEHIPELKHLHINCDSVTDMGIANIQCLEGLEILLIYSNQITDDCLRYIEPLKALHTIDLQNSPKVSKEGFNNLVNKLPNLRDVYKPFKK
jgi:hypothetical protein